MKNKLILLILLSAATYGLASPLKIIGNDDRVQITDRNAKPFHNSIGYLSLRIDDSLYACTATVIGPRHAITSAHCIYNARTYRMVDKASFIPALRSERKKTQYPYGFFQTS